MGAAHVITEAPTAASQASAGAALTAIGRERSVGALIHAIREGAWVGLFLALVVAAWVVVRLTLWGAAAPEIWPLLEALQLAPDAEPARGVLDNRITILTLHLGASAMIGGGLGVAIRSTSFPWVWRVLTAALVVAAEYAAWHLAGWHVGPWVRALVWYHLATTTLTLVVTLDADRATLGVGPTPRRV
jgi:hypothetical protein